MFSEHTGHFQTNAPTARTFLIFFGTEYLSGTLGTGTSSVPRGTPWRALSLDNLSINTIRTLSIDAVQQANSGHPGTPMALAPVSAMRHEFGGHVELTANKIVSAHR